MSAELQQHLQAIYDDRGQLTPGIVVEEARAKNHPLHDRFEWDNKVAGDRYRRAQAADLIRSVRVVYRTEDQRQEKVRAFHAIPKPEGPTYMPIEEIAADPFMTKLLLQSAEREWKALLSKYAHLQEFLELVRRSVA